MEIRERCRGTVHFGMERNHLKRLLRKHGLI
jgi:hypothetical protein